MMTPETIELFDGFLHNDLSKLERENFEQRLKLDIGFKAEYEDYLKGVEIVELIGIRKDLNYIFEESKKQNFLAKRIVWMPMAATLLLAALSLVFWNKLSMDSNQTLFLTYYQPYPNIIASRGIADNVELALQSYSENDFSKAEQLLGNLPIVNDTILFYQGLCRLSLNQADSSLVLFRQLKESSVFYQQISWYSAMAFLLKGDSRAAHISLKSINEGQFKYVESREVLEKIEPK